MAIVISPILNRELLTFLRAKRAFAGLLLFLVVMSGAAAICWWGTLEGGRVTDRDLLSRNLFHTIMISQLFIFSVYALILTSTKVNSEIDTKTLDLLVTAPLRSIHIILAKYASALTVILLLVFASAPVLSLCFLLGGVAWQEVVTAYYIVLLAVLSYGMIGLACSTVCRKNHVALMGAFVLGILFYCGLALMSAAVLALADEYLHIRVRDIKKVFFGIFATTSPIMVYVINNLNMRGMPLAGFGLVPHTIFQSFVFIVSFLIAWLGFRQLAGRTAVRTSRRVLRHAVRRSLETPVGATVAGKAPAPEDEPAGVAPLPRPVSMKKRRRYKPIRDRVNPVYAREDRQFFSRRWKHRLIRYGLALVVFLGIAAFLHEIGGSYRFSEEMCFLGLITAALAGLFAPLLAARAVTGEIETGSLPLLLSTPLRPTEILFGKLAVLVKHTFRAEVLFSFLLLFTFRWPGGGAWVLLVDWIKILIPLFAITLYLLAVGLFFSVLCRKTVTAIVLTYAAILALAFSPLLMAVLYEIVFRRTPLRGFFQDTFAFVFPVVCPWLYFVPDVDVNLWHDNHQWGNIIGFFVVTFSIAATLLTATAVAFARKFHYRLRFD